MRSAPHPVVAERQTTEAERVPASRRKKRRPKDTVPGTAVEGFRRSLRPLWAQTPGGASAKHTKSRAVPGTVDNAGAQPARKRKAEPRNVWSRRPFTGVWPVSGDNGASNRAERTTPRGRQTTDDRGGAQTRSATSMVATPHWGARSLSVDLTSDETPATGGRQRFARSRKGEAKGHSRRLFTRQQQTTKVERDSDRIIRP